VGFVERENWLNRKGKDRAWRLINLGNLLSLVEPNYEFGSVLDLGCGFGDLALYLFFDFKTYVGIDKDKAAIALASTRFKQPNIYFFTKDIAMLPSSYFKVFDTIFLIDIIEHLKKPERLIESILQNFKGLMLVSTPNKEITKEANPFHYKEFTEEELRAIFGKKLKKIKQEGNNFYLLVDCREEKKEHQV